MLELIQLSALHLAPVDLQLADGECVAIQGESGSGKSVLLRAVADLDPHQGVARLDGQACSDLPATLWRQRVAYVPAESGWWDERVRDHFAPDADLAALLTRLGLKPELADGPVQRLSTGERQRPALSEMRANTSNEAEQLTPACRLTISDCSGVWPRLLMPKAKIRLPKTMPSPVR